MGQDGTALDLFMTHRSALIDYASRIVGNRSQAEDLVQEAWLRFDNAAHGQRVDHPRGYLFRIVRNLALDLRRTKGYAAASDNGRLDEIPAATASPEQTALHREQLRILGEAIAELPERTRIAFYMYRIEGKSLKEIARHLGVSQVRVHQLVKDAVRHGAKRLDREA